MIKDYWDVDEYFGYCVNFEVTAVYPKFKNGDGTGEGFGSDDGDGLGSLDRSLCSGWSWIIEDARELRWR
jgi:hypothetical protein